MSLKEEKKDSLLEKTASVVGPVVKPKPKLSLGQKFIHLVTEKGMNIAKGKYKNHFGSINDHSRKQLTELTGSAQLALTLDALTPRLTQGILAAVHEKLEESNKFYKDGLMQTLNDQNQFIAECLDATMLKMMVRIALNTKIEKESKEVKDKTEVIEGDVKVTFPEMASYLLGITEKQLKHIHNQIAKIEKIPNEKERKQKLNSLLEPFKINMMHQLMPHGADDIVLPNNLIMNNVKVRIYKAIEEALPILMIKGYHAVMDPTLEYREEDEKTLKGLPGGELLNAFADLIAKKLPQKVPGLVDANIITVIDEMAPKLFIDENDPEKIKQHSTWLGNGIRQLANSKDANIQVLWNLANTIFLLSSNICCLIWLKILRQMIPNNMLNAITKHFFSMVTFFFDNNQKEIQEAMEQLKAAKTPEQKAEKEAALIELFEPLSNQVIVFVGLDTPEDLPVADIFKRPYHQHRKGTGLKKTC